MKLNSKETRERHAYRVWKTYVDGPHGCSAYRAIERSIIQSSGYYKEHCDYCGYGGLPMGGQRSSCNHPGYKVEYQCMNCRYRCHERFKMKRHCRQGHQMKLVDLYWKRDNE